MVIAESSAATACCALYLELSKRDRFEFMNKIGRYGSLDARRRIHSLNSLKDELRSDSTFLRNTLVLTGTLSHLTMEFALGQAQELPAGLSKPLDSLRSTRDSGFRYLKTYNYYYRHNSPKTSLLTKLLLVFSCILLQFSSPNG